ncbi:MAG: hypothetical protein KF838_11385 [Phycisphaeraceae bacterium]|nr:MAG: hypothetical protein KF838_11385 [Phycisphaeraceae bacterium]
MPSGMMDDLCGLACAAAVASALLLAGEAAASPIVVLNDGEHRDTIVSRGGYDIHLFANEVRLDPFDGARYPEPNTLVIRFGYSFGQVSGGIIGNPLPDWPPLPVQTPSLLAQGGMKIEGQFVDTSWSFAEPQYDPTSGGTNSAALSHGFGSDFNLNDFTQPGDMAYIGYATSDLSIFGYMQIERVTEVDWKLIGYAYDPSGGGILVQNLVPAPGGVAVLALAAAPLLTRSRRRRENAQ